MADPQSDFGEDVIVGVLDTGILPESKSFSDIGLNLVPVRWKGECEVGTDFNASHCKLGDQTRVPRVQATRPV